MAGLYRAFAPLSPGSLATANSSQRAPGIPCDRPRRGLRTRRDRLSAAAEKSMTKPHALALGIGTASLVCGAAAFAAPFPFDLLLAWMAFSCLLAAGAYLANRPDVLGKRTGRITPLRALPVFPYLMAIRLACEIIRRIRRFPALSRVADEVWVGGRCAAGDLPPRLGLLVDLTAESSAPAPLRTLPCYRSLPVLDGSVPPDE